LGSDFSHRDSERASHVILCDLAAFALVVAAHEADGLAVNHEHDTLPVAVIRKLRDGDVVLLHFHEAILYVVNQIEDVAPDVTRGLVAVGIVGVGVAIGIRHSMDMVRIEIIQRHIAFGFEISSSGVVLIRLIVRALPRLAIAQRLRELFGAEQALSPPKEESMELVRRERRD